MSVHRLPIVTLYFQFYGPSFDPDEVTRRLGIEPTVQFRPGDAITKDGRGCRRGYGWWISTGGAETVHIDGLLRDIRRRIDVSPATIKKLTEDLNLELVLVCGVRQNESAESRPDLDFPPAFIEWLSEMGAALDVEIVF